MTGDLERWRGKGALVTGASSGIGKAIVERLVLAGLRVAVWGRRRERIDALRAELGEHVLPQQVDVRDATAVETSFEQLCEQWGGVDVLVNNAGLGYQESLLDGDLERQREMLEVNVLALCQCTQLAVADMRRRGGEGQIVHLSSLAAHRVAPGGGVYAATKAAVRSLTESLRQELHQAGLPIRVTAISPGYVQTEFHARFFQSEQKANELYTGYRVLDAEDVADTVVYALGTPPHVQLHDVLIRSRHQPT